MRQTVKPEEAIRQDEDALNLLEAETLDKLRRFLNSALFQQVGPVIAKKVVAAFGINTIGVIEKTPHRLTEVRGIGKRRLLAITNGWTAQHRLKKDCIMLVKLRNSNLENTRRIL